MTILDVDLVSDVVCPWCFLGSHRLDRVIAALKSERPDVEIVVHHHPFELMPGTPRAGTNVPEMLRRKYGAGPQKMWERIHAMAAESGLALDLTKQPMAYPTIPAHTLVRLGRESGVEHGLHHALFEAYFTDARDIADPEVLADVGAAHGIDRARASAFVQDETELELTRTEAKIWQQHGVTGVPFFVFGEKLAFAGAQTEAVIRQVIDRALAMPRESAS